MLFSCHLFLLFFTSHISERSVSELAISAASCLSLLNPVISLLILLMHVQ